MDTTLAALLVVLACTFIGMIAAIIAATNTRSVPTGTQKPKPVPKLMQAAKPAELKAVQWFDVPVRVIPQDTVQYKGVVVVTRHIDVRYPLN